MDFQEHVLKPATWGIPPSPPEPLVTFCRYIEKVHPVHDSWSINGGDFWSHGYSGAGSANVIGGEGVGEATLLVFLSVIALQQVSQHDSWE